MASVAVSRDHHQALSRAKIKLMAKPDSAFFTTLCFSMKHIFDDSIPTACSDGITIRYNPEFFMGLDADEQLFLVLHETLHPAYLHSLRVKPGMDLLRANIAMDHVINLQLIAAGFKMPKEGHADPQYANMAWEAVYKLLPENPGKPRMEDVKPGTGDGKGSGQSGSSSLSPEELTREIEDILIRASVQSRMAGDKPGSIPGDLQIFINGLLDPKLPWQRMVQKYLRQYDKNDYSFKKPNRRFFPKYYLPSLHGQKLMDLAIAVDISGSVSNENFHRFVSEIASLFRMMKPGKITVIQFDTRIISVDTVKNITELMAIKFSGRGGTAIEPVIQWAEENKPELLMVFSDGEFNFKVTEYKRDLLWLIHDNPRFTAPFGKTIHYSMK